MDPRRFLSVTALSAAAALALSGCALLRGPDANPILLSEAVTPEVTTPDVGPEPVLPSEAEPSQPPVEPGSTARPYLEAVAQAEPPRGRRTETPPTKPSALEAALATRLATAIATRPDGVSGGGVSARRRRGGSA